MERKGARKENSSTFAPETASYHSSTGNSRELFFISMVIAPAGACALAVGAAKGETQSAAIISSNTGFMALPSDRCDHGRRGRIPRLDGPAMVRARRLAV
jgi:hypothetical protein